MLIQIKEWILQQRKRAAISRFRKHSAALGYDLSHLSDDELEQGVNKAATTISQFGITIAGAGKVFRRLGLAAQKMS
jgi:hypothetical protein